MNRNLLMALALPSLLFYQSNAPILYSSEKLIAQVKEEQRMLAFDLSATGNTLIISNDQVKESKEDSESERTAEHSQERATENAAEKNENKSDETIQTQKTGRALPKTNKEEIEHSAHKKSTDVLETIEQKISALPVPDLPLDKKGERELVRMLANMSGTILYGTKMTETNRNEYIIF